MKSNHEIPAYRIHCMRCISCSLLGYLLAGKEVLGVILYPQHLI